MIVLDLDRIDIQLLEALQHDGRATNQALGERRQPPAVAAVRSLHEPASPVMSHPSRNGDSAASSNLTPTVSILIPTLDRYPHLFNLLAQIDGFPQWAGRD